MLLENTEIAILLNFSISLRNKTRRFDYLIPKFKRAFCYIII